MNGVSLAGMLGSYVGVTTRGIPAREFFGGMAIDWTTEQRFTLAAALILLLLPPVVLLVAACLKKLRWPSVPGVCIGLTMLASGLYGFLTNGEEKIVDLSPALFGVLVLLLECNLFGVWRQYVSCMCAVLMCVGVLKGVTRDRVRAGGLGHFYEDTVLHTVKSGFFEGVASGNAFLIAGTEMYQAFIHSRTGASIWFGPRLQWGYALLGLESPKDEPVVWCPGVDFASDEQDKWFQKILDHRHGVLIFLNDDYAFFRKDQIESLAQRYAIVKTTRVLTVMRLKNGL
jgi:hypothetical protein